MDAFAAILLITWVESNVTALTQYRAVKFHASGPAMVPRWIEHGVAG
jgi:hypothetical protein